MSLKSRIAAVVSAVLMAVTMASCSNTSYVLTIDGEQVKSGVYLGYLTQSYMTASNQVSDPYTDPFNQKIGNLSFKDYVINSAIEMAKEKIAIAQLFAQYECKFTDEELASMDEYTESLWSYYGSIFEDNGTGKESFKTIMKYDYMENNLFEKLYDKGGVKEVPEDDIKEYFNKNNLVLKKITFSFYNTDGTTMNDEQKAALKKKAEGYLNRATASNMNELIDEYAESLKTEEEKKKEEEAEKEEGDEKEEEEVDLGKYFTVVDLTANNLDEDTLKAYKDLAVGKKTLVTVKDTSYEVVMKYDPLSETAEPAYDDTRSTCLYQMKTEEFEKMLADKVAALKVERNESAIRRYNPKNIVISY